MQIDSELSQRQLLAIKYILESSSMEEASRKARVTRTTLYQWFKNDTFQKILRRQREEIINESLERLKGAINKATDGLIELLKTEKPDLRRLVCNDILEHALRALEIERIEKRLDRIEQVVCKGGSK